MPPHRATMERGLTPFSSVHSPRIGGVSNDGKGLELVSRPKRHGRPASSGELANRTLSRGFESMTATHVSVLLLSSLSFLTTWIGVSLALRVRENANAIATGIGFSAGIMLLISLLELVPKGAGLIGAWSALLSVALGAGLVWSAHLIIPHTHLVVETGIVDSKLVRSAYLVAFGLILHDFPEGFAMANAYVASPELGVLVALAIALHNVPEEFAMAVPAVAIHRPLFLYGAALLSALAEPLGAVLGLVAVEIAPGLNGHFMAFAAGAMTFVSVHELFPMARRYRRPKCFVGGICLSVMVYVLLAVITA